MSEKKSLVGFIGIGVMGRSMATHLLNAGYPVLVYNRTKSRAESLLEKGAVWKDSVQEVAAEADVIITMVGYPADVLEVYFGEKGLINNSKPGTYLIDMTTSKPSLAKEIDQAAREKGLYTLDAPVSGGDVGAQNGTLTIMVGGEPDTFEKMKPILECMGKNIILQGGAGAGQHTKMCNQIAIASNMIGVSEAMIYAKRSGLDPETVLKSIEAGAAGSWSLSNLAPRMIKGNFEPGFFVKHFIKDIDIALSEAEAMEFDTPGLKLAKSLYDELALNHKENKGTQVLYELLDK